MKLWHGLVGIGAATALLFGGQLVGGGFGDQKTCFQYDTASDKYTFCGTQPEIVAQFRDAGHEWAVSGEGLVSDPVGLCVTRSVVQAQMNDWPEKYRQAFEEGCRS